LQNCTVTVSIKCVQPILSQIVLSWK